jgi:hypothetical protein
LLSTPALITRDAPAIVRLQVAADAAQLDSQAGVPAGLASRMRATLSAPDLEVHPIAPELQAVSRVAPTEWTWEIRGVRAGPATLHVTLSAALVLDGVETPRVLRTFERTVTVDVTLGQRVTGFLAQQWQWVLATLGAPLLGGLWRWRRRARDPSRPEVPGAGTT